MHWTKEQKRRIWDSLGQSKCCFVGVAPNGTSTDSILSDRENPYDLIIGYSKQHNIYAVWNPYLHLFRGNVFSVSFSRISSILNKTTDDIISVYSSLNDGNSSYEKKLLIRPTHIDKFCKSWREYLLPDRNEEKYKCKVVWADKFSLMPKGWEDCIEEKVELIERRRDMIHRMRRDRLFRLRVLEDYGHQCAICRCNITEILEAAHVFEVRYGGDDQRENGICLCANHHMLYDKGLISINWADLTLTIRDARVQTMDWYQRFMDEYNGHIIAAKE